MAKKQVKYHSDLTDAQYRVWETILKEKRMDLGWQDGRKFISRFDGSMKVAGGAKILPKTMQAIEKAGLIKFDPYPHHNYFRLTEFGKDELPTAELAALDTEPGRVGAGDAPLPDTQRYQAGDGAGEIERLKRALEAVQRQLTDVDPEFWYLNVSNALWMIKHALNEQAAREPEGEG